MTKKIVYGLAALGIVGACTALTVGMSQIRLGGVSNLLTVTLAIIESR